MDPAPSGPVPQVPRRDPATSGGSSPDGPSSSGGSNDPYGTLAALYAAMFGVGSGSGRNTDQLAAQVVPVQTGQTQGGPNVAGLLVVGLIAGAAWFWWKHRKGAATNA